MAFENRPKDFFAKQIRSSHLIASGGIIDPESSDWDEQLPHLRLMIYPRDTLEVDTSTGATEYIDGAFEGIIPPTLLNDVKYNDDGQVVGGSGLKVGQDVWLFISGAQGTTHMDHDGDGELDLSEMERRSDHGVVLFGGDVVVSGTLFAERQVIEVDLSHEGQLFVSGNLRAQDYNRDINFVQFRSPGYREDIQYPDLWLSGEAAMLTHLGSHANPKMWITDTGVMTAEEAGHTGFFEAPAYADVVIGSSTIRFTAGTGYAGVAGDDVRINFLAGAGTTEEMAGDFLLVTIEDGATSIADIVAVGPESSEVVISLLVDGGDTTTPISTSDHDDLVALASVELTNGDQFGTATAGRVNGSATTADPDGDGSPVSGYIACTEAQWALYAKGGPYVNKTLSAIHSSDATIKVGSDNFIVSDKIDINGTELVADAVSTSSGQFLIVVGDPSGQAAEIGAAIIATTVLSDNMTVTVDDTIVTIAPKVAFFGDAIEFTWTPSVAGDYDHVFTDGVVGIPDADGTVLNLTTTNTAFDGTTGIALNDLRDDSGTLVDPIVYYTIEQLNAAISQASGAVFANRNDAIEAGAAFLSFNPGDTLANSSVIFNVDSVYEQVGINTAIPSASLDVRRRQVRNDNNRSTVRSDGDWLNQGNEQVTFLLHADDEIGHPLSDHSNPLSDASNQHDDVAFYVWGRPGAKSNFAGATGDFADIEDAAFPGQQKSVAAFGGDVVVSGTLYTEGGDIDFGTHRLHITGDDLTDTSNVWVAGGLEVPGALHSLKFTATETVSGFSATAAKIEVEAADSWSSPSTSPARMNFYTDDDTNPAFTIANDGDVGIGTEDPDAQLEIIQDSTTEATLRMSYEKTDGTDATHYADFEIGTAYDGYGSVTGDLNILLQSTYENRVRIAGVPEERAILQLQSRGTSPTNDALLQFDITGDGTVAWGVGVHDHSDSFKIAPNDDLSTDTAVTILHGNQNVGIGTNTPENKLDVFGSLAVGSGGTYAGTSAGPTDGAIFEGSVGIGNNAPNHAKLQVTDDAVPQFRIEREGSAQYASFEISDLGSDGEYELKVETNVGDIILDPSTGIIRVWGTDNTGGIVRQDQAQAFDGDGLLLTDQSGNGIKIFDQGGIDIAPTSILTGGISLPASASTVLNPAQLNIVSYAPHDQAGTTPPTYPIFWPLAHQPSGADDGQWSVGGTTANHPLRIHGLKEDNTNYHPTTPGDACIQPKVLVAGRDGHIMYTESVLGRLGQDRDSRYYNSDESGGAQWPDGTEMGDDAADVPGIPYDNGYIVPVYTDHDTNVNTPNVLIQGWDGDTPVGHAIDDLNHGLRELDENNAWNWNDTDGIAGGDEVVLKDSSNLVGIGTSRPDSKLHVARLEGQDIDIKIEGSQFENQDPASNPAITNSQPIDRLEFSFDSQYWLAKAASHGPAGDDNMENEYAALVASTPALSVAAITRSGFQADDIVDSIIQNGRMGGDIVFATQHYGNVIDAMGNDIETNLGHYRDDPNNPVIPGTADAGTLTPLKIRGATHRKDLQVLILSGTTTLGDATAADPKYFSDVNFFVSGSRDCAATAAAPLGSGIRGAACFGGDVVISGTLYTSNIINTSTISAPHVLHFEYPAATYSHVVGEADPPIPALDSIQFPGAIIHPWSGLGDDPDVSADPAGIGADSYKNKLQVFVNGQRIKSDEYIIDGSSPDRLKLKTGIHPADIVTVDVQGDPNSWGATVGLHLGDILDVRTDQMARWTGQFGTTSDDTISFTYVGAVGAIGNNVPIKITHDVVYENGVPDPDGVEVTWDNTGPSGAGLEITYMPNTGAEPYGPTLLDIRNAVMAKTWTTEEKDVHVSADNDGTQLCAEPHVDDCDGDPTTGPGTVCGDPDSPSAGANNNLYAFTGGIDTTAEGGSIRWSNEANVWFVSDDSNDGGGGGGGTAIMIQDEGIPIDNSPAYINFQGAGIEAVVDGGGVHVTVGGISTVDDIGDVYAAAPATGNILKYNAGAHAKFVMMDVSSDAVIQFDVVTIGSFHNSTFVNPIQDATMSPGTVAIDASTPGVIAISANWPTVAGSDVTSAWASHAINAVVTTTCGSFCGSTFSTAPTGGNLGSTVLGGDPGWYPEADATGTDTTVTIQEEGTDVVTAMEVLNFEGSAVTVTDVGGVATVTVDTASTLSDLSDVSLPGPANGDSLMFDASAGGGSGGWTHSTPVSTLAGLTDTDTAGLATGNILKCIDGVNWMPARNLIALDTMTMVNADYETPVPGTPGGEVEAIAGKIGMMVGGMEQPAAGVLEITKKHVAPGSASFTYDAMPAHYETVDLTGSGGAGDTIQLFYVAETPLGTNGNGVTVTVTTVSSPGVAYGVNVSWDDVAKILSIEYAYDTGLTDVQDILDAVNGVSYDWWAVLTDSTMHADNVVTQIDPGGVTSGGTDGDTFTISTNANVIDAAGVRIEFAAAVYGAPVSVTFERANRDVGMPAESRPMDIYTIHMDTSDVAVTAVEIETAINNFQVATVGDVNMLDVSSPSSPGGIIEHRYLPNYDHSMHVGGPGETQPHVVGEVFAYIMFDDTTGPGWSTKAGSWSGLSTAEGYTPIASTDLVTKEYAFTPVRATPVTETPDPTVPTQLLAMYDATMKRWPQIIPIRSDNTGPIVIMLPPADHWALYGAQQFIFKDEEGNAATAHAAGHTIMIMPWYDDTIDNYSMAAPVQLINDYDSITVYTDGTNWHLI